MKDKGWLKELLINICGNAVDWFFQPFQASKGFGAKNNFTQINDVIKFVYVLQIFLLFFAWNGFRRSIEWFCWWNVSTSIAWLWATGIVWIQHKFRPNIRHWPCSIDSFFPFGGNLASTFIWAKVLMLFWRHSLVIENRTAPFRLSFWFYLAVSLIPLCKICKFYTGWFW